MARSEPAFFTARIAPVMDRHCVGCHGPDKQKAKLRLDSFEQLMRGAESGAVVKPGDLAGSELYRRITLPRTEEEAMPSDGKPALSADEVKVIELWIREGASPTRVVSEFPGAPALKPHAGPVVALAPDWRPKAAEIAALEREIGLRLVPRSKVPTDGLILRTASAPARCDDAALARLAPLADYLVEAELARTKITDAGLKALSAWSNLRTLDLSRTAVTSQGLGAVRDLKRLEVVNLTDTGVDDAGVAPLKALPALKRLWLFGTKCTEPESAAPLVAR